MRLDSDATAAKMRVGTAARFGLLPTPAVDCHCMFSSASAPKHSGTSPSDENRDDRKCPEGQEVKGSRNGVAGFEVSANGHAPNPQNDRELDRKHQGERNASHGQPPRPKRRNAAMPNHPPGRKDGDAKHDGFFHQFRRPHAQSRDYPECADGAEHESGSKHEGEIELRQP